MIWGSLANCAKVSVRLVKDSRPSDAVRTFLLTLARISSPLKRRSKHWNGKQDRENDWKRSVSNLYTDQEHIESNYSYVPFIQRNSTRITMNKLLPIVQRRQSQSLKMIGSSYMEKSTTYFPNLQNMKRMQTNDRGTVRRMVQIQEGLRESPQKPWFSRFTNGVSSIDGITWQTRIDNRDDECTIKDEGWHWHSVEPPESDLADTILAIGKGSHRCHF